MEKFKFLSKVNLLVCLFIVSTSILAQNIPIEDLNGTYPDISFDFSDFNLLKSGSNNLRGQKKIQLQGTSPWYTETTNLWPEGAWGRGYFDSFAPIDFVNNIAKEGKYWGAYPLQRVNSKFSRGHLHAYEFEGDIDQIEIVEDAIDYLLDEQDFVDGGFTLHNHRVSQYNTNDHLNNGSDAYATAYALRNLSEYYLSNHNYKRNEVLSAIDKAAKWFINDDNIEQSTTNANGRGLTIWALSAAYKVTKDCEYLPTIFELTQQLIEIQDKSSSFTDGVWFTGGPNTVGNLQLYHDTKIQYHMLTLRGLIEAFDVTPDEYGIFKEELVNTINKAVNHLINYRVNESDPSKKILKKWFSTNSVENNGVLNLPNNYIFSDSNAVDAAGTFIEPLVLLAYYSKNSTYYTTQDHNRLKNITNCIAQKLNSNQPYHIDGIGYYANYMEAIDDNTEVFPWVMPEYIATGYSASETTGKVVSGDFDNDGEKDDIAAFYYLGNGLSKIHVWKSNSKLFEYQGSNGWWQSPSWYNSNNITDRVVVGDFDGDGYEDDIAAIYKSGPYQTAIHVWKSNGNQFTYAGSNGWWNTNGYDADQISGRVVSGDFNGNGFDDIAAFYNYGSNQTRIHVWKSNGNQFIYAGSNGWWNTNGYDADQISGRVVSGDFNGNGVDDIAAFYDNGNGSTNLHVWQYNGSQFRYDKGSQGWWNSSGYDVTKITGKVVSGNFYNDSSNRDEIAAFYDYGNNATRIHLWKYDGTDFSYDKGSQGWWKSSGYDANRITGRVVSGGFNNANTEDIVGLSEYDTKIHVWKSDLALTEFKFAGPNGWWSDCNISTTNLIVNKNYFETKTSINIFENNNSVLIYPIPSSGQINIEVSENEIIKKLRVHDITGKEIYNGKDYLVNKVILDVNARLSGLYLITITTDKKVYKRKVIFGK